MRIVVGLHDFSTFAGTETYSLTVAEELQRLGHEVVVHAPTLGPIAGEARDRGIDVVAEEHRLPASCDAVLAQDAGSAFALAARYPDARRLLVVHSDYFALQSPPQLQGVCDAVVVLNDRVRRHVERLAAVPPVVRLRQPVDLKRFGTRGGVASRAARALILGNYLRGAVAEQVAGACRAAGIEPVFAGTLATPTHAPELAIADADLVIGLGRCVVEAMAGRRAAYVHGIAGGDGWVTPERHATLEADGFGGTATPAILDAAGLASDLAAWDPEMGMLNRQLATAHHDAGAHAAELVAEIRALGAGPSAPTDHTGELARLVRLEWQSWNRYTGALEESRDLRERLEREHAESERLRGELADALGRAAAFRTTRRYRLARLLGAPLDALRRARR